MYTSGTRGRQIIKTSSFDSKLKESPKRVDLFRRLHHKVDGEVQFRFLTCNSFGHKVIRTKSVNNPKKIDNVVQCGCIAQ